MGLTPDEIAHRAFTPSADGYHQGEVRAFLERVAAQLRGLQAAMPEGRAELAELTSAMQHREPRLAALEQQLADALNQLGSATAVVRDAQVATAAQLATAERIAADHAAASLRASELTQTAVEVAAEQRAVLEQLGIERMAIAAELAVAQKLTAEQREASEHLADAGERSVVQLSAAQQLTAQQRDATERLAAAEEHAAARLAAAQDLAVRQQQMAQRSGTAGGLTTDRVTEATTDTNSAANPPLTGIIPQAYRETASSLTDTPAADTELSSLFGSDLEEQALFSDNAIDLLDGVLDDVMGNINNKGNPA